MIGNALPEDPLDKEEEKELSALLSRLLGTIHRLTPQQTQAVMDVDEHMRREELTHEDLEVLRSIEQASNAQVSKLA